MRVQPDRPEQVDEAVALNVGAICPLDIVCPSVSFRVTVSPHPISFPFFDLPPRPLASLVGVFAEQTPQRGLRYEGEDSLHVRATRCCGGLIELERGVRRPRFGRERRDGVALPAARISPQIVKIR